MFADVYVGYPLESSYTYRIPEGMDVKIGVRVKVNFSNRKLTAFVHRVHNNKPEKFKPKDIIEVIDDNAIFDERLIRLSKYIADNYISTVGETLSMALPSGLKPSERFKAPFANSTPGDIHLTDEQKEAYNNIIKSYENGDTFHLIFGITGSGKTEIYIEVAKYFIQQNRSVIYLVPEISLSAQIFERLYGVFGDKLVVYHSHLTANQRLHHWIKFYSGEAVIAIGTRSAVFLQCQNLGLVIIDEENDASYKEHSSPRYNARRVAFYRCKEEKCLLLMGSATPSVESLYAAERGIVKLHELKNRYGSAELPEVEIVKIRPGDFSDIISSKLKLYTKRAVDNGNQVIYLLNRRGFAPFVTCVDCGEVVECPHCSISLNYHKDGSMLCHYCGYKIKEPDKCDKCGSQEIIKLGSGTQRIEEIVENTFKDFNIFRLDKDSSRKKDAVFNMVKEMENGNVDILLGTQLVAKGFDFPGVTVVGVLLADIGLNMPDFRASERIFSLLIQVAGRSGRGKDKGKVVLQTLNDENEIFNYIKNMDYYGFYKSELSMRKALDYPPFSRIARLLVRGKDEKHVIKEVQKLRTAIDDAIKKARSNISVLGPSEAPHSRIADNYRHHIILKSKNTEEMRKIILSSRGVVSPGNVYLEIDIDPYDLL